MSRERAMERIAKFQEVAKSVMMTFRIESGGQFPGVYKKVLGLTEESDSGRRALLSAAEVALLSAAAGSGWLGVGISRPDEDMGVFLEMLPINEVVEFGDTIHHELDQNGNHIKWSQKFFEKEHPLVSLTSVDGPNIETIVSFVQEREIDLVVIPIDFEKRSDVDISKKTREIMGQLMVDTNTSIFLVR